MCKVLFFIVIQVKPYLKQKFLTHQSSSFLLIQEMFIGFHHPLNLKKNFKLLFFGRLKRLPYFHVLLSKCKDLKSAPCFLSSPRGLILVANWLFSCQPSYVIVTFDWHILVSVLFRLLLLPVNRTRRSFSKQRD